MKTTRENLQRIADGTMEGWQYDELRYNARRILEERLFEKFKRYVGNHEMGHDDLLDFSCRFYVQTCWVESDFPHRNYFGFGITKEEALQNFYDHISSRMNAAMESDYEGYCDKINPEGMTFRIKRNGRSSSKTTAEHVYHSVYFHYCYGKNRINEDQLLSLCHEEYLRTVNDKKNV